MLQLFAVPLLLSGGGGEEGASETEDPPAPAAAEAGRFVTDGRIGEHLRAHLADCKKGAKLA